MENKIFKGSQVKVFVSLERIGDTLLVDWYPCRRKSDGVEGFWDCVTQTFIEAV